MTVTNRMDSLWFLSASLVDAIKNQFLKTARRYQELGYGRAFADLLVFLALDGSYSHLESEFSTAIRALPQEGLENAIWSAERLLLASGEKKQLEFWKIRLEPFFTNIWPQSESAASPELGRKFAKLCLASGESFPLAVDCLRDWLKLADEPDHLVLDLKTSGQCKEHPNEALEFLSLLVRTKLRWMTPDLNECLAEIVKESPALKRDRRHIRLVDYGT